MAGKRKTENGKGRGLGLDAKARPSSFPVSSFPLSESGFTLLELLVVMTIIGILAAVAIPALRDSPQRAREAALKEDLFTLRSTIDQYHGDKGYYPPDLATLVSEGYLRQIPIDPMTKSRDTWAVEFEQLEPTAEGEGTTTSVGGTSGTQTTEQSATPGVIDVHSGSTEKALDGTVYKDW
jgi:general secretion pathway protein G